VIVTSETSEHLPATRKATGYEGLAIVDPSNSLATELKKRGLIDIAISKWNGYENGMAQPAILVVRRSPEIGNEELEVLESWAIVPSLMVSSVFSISFYIG